VSKEKKIMADRSKYYNSQFCITEARLQQDGGVLVKKSALSLYLRYLVFLMPIHYGINIICN
jgi:hypothetical protein